jgi:tetratricopeptide (TPR) repeat protein
MLKFLRRLFRRAPDAPEPGSLVEELWLGEPTGEDEGRFVEIEEAGYAARYVSVPDEETGKGSGRLELRLDRANLFAWTEAPVYRYADFVLEGELAAPAGNPYSACGFLFRYQDEGDFYALLVSNKGFFRLDLVLSGKPRALIAWTELPDEIRSKWAELPARGQSFSLRVIARGEHLTIMIDDEWVAEAVDDSFDAGYVAFAAQRYAEGQAPAVEMGTGLEKGTVLEATAGPGAAPAVFELRSCMVESRAIEVESWYYRHNYYLVPGAPARRRLAETFFAMGENLPAAIQLRKLEKLRPLDADELFLKAEAALRLGLREEAEAALDACLALSPGHVDAVEEKANLLYLRGRYLELREALSPLLTAKRDNPRLLCLSGHARFNLGDFTGAAEDYGAAAGLEAEDSAGAALGRMNEARAWDQAGKKKEAATAYLSAARLLAAQEADDDLELALGRLSALRPGSLEAKAIRAKTLYRRGKIEEAARLLAELVVKGAADSGSRYTLGLILAARGEGEKALEQFEAALGLEPEYALYAFRYAERLFLLEQAGKSPRGPGAARAAIARALELADDGDPQLGWILNLAGQEELSRDDLESARIHLEAARAALPTAPEIAINIADLESRLGGTERALAVLAPFQDLAACRNQAGNVYARAAEASAAIGDSARPSGDSARPSGDSARPSDELLEAAAREYLAAARIEPYSAEYQANLAAAYIELERYADAEERLRKSLDLGGGIRALMLTGNLARIYGDLPRAEAAYRLALEAAPEDPALLAALGRTYLALRNYAKAEATAKKLDRADAGRAARLRAEILEATTEPLSCSGCGRAWRVPRDLPAQSSATIRAMPPDDSPAGSCPRCGKVYCIACRVGALSADKRFTCPDCGEALKLSDARLRYLVREGLRRAGSE